MKPLFKQMLKRIDRLSPDIIRQMLSLLARENSVYEAALNSTLDGIIVCDLEHRPLFINRSAEKMLRFSTWHEDLPLWQLIEDEALQEFFSSVLQGEEKVLGREFALDRPGNARIVAISVTELLSDGRISGTLIHIDDITDKRKREAQLRRAESLAALTTLAAGVAHEIKNPLASIRIQLGIIRRLLQQCQNLHERERTMTHQLGHNLDLVEQEIDRLNAIVVDFLFAVRPMDIILMRDRAEEVVREVAEFMKDEIEQQHITLRLEIAENLPEVMLDRKYLKQALLNIVKNAIAAMPEGGTLTMSVTSANDELLLSVTDTGIGIPEELQPKIFEPYFTTKETGTGLGLTITFKIVKEHNGEITVTSKPGKGSTFTIHIPVPQPERKSLPPGEEHATTGTSVQAGAGMTEAELQEVAREAQRTEA